jgi:hypothetical protein
MCSKPIKHLKKCLTIFEATFYIQKRRRDLVPTSGHKITPTLKKIGVKTKEPPPLLSIVIYICLGS